MANILGWIATIIFTLMLVPQIIKTIKMRTVKGVSLSLFVMYLIGNLFAIVYATLIKQPPLQIKYLLAILTTIFYIFYYFRIRKSENEIES